MTLLNLRILTCFSFPIRLLELFIGSFCLRQCCYRGVHLHGRLAKFGPRSGRIFTLLRTWICRVLLMIAEVCHIQVRSLNINASVLVQPLASIQNFIVLGTLVLFHQVKVLHFYSTVRVSAACLILFLLWRWESGFWSFYFLGVFHHAVQL